MKSFWMILAVFILNSASALETFSKENFRGQIEIIPEKGRIGIPLKLILQLYHPSEYQFQEKEALERLLKTYGYHPFPFRLIKKELSDPIQSNQEVKQTLTLMLEPLFPGEHSLTFFDLSFISKKDDTRRLLETPVLKIAVLPALETSLEGISFPDPLIFRKNIPLSLNATSEILLGSSSSLLEEKKYNAKQAAYKSFPVLEILSLGLIGLFLFLALTWKERKKQTAFDAKKEAEMLLKKFEQIPEGAPLSHYVELDLGVRNYIAQKYRLQANSLTGDELFEELQHQTTPSMMSSLKQYLNLTQKIKFADYRPDSQDLKHLKNWINEFILDHEPVEEHRP